MKRFGIDISKWQGNFDLAEAKKSGVEFAIIKGGGGDDGIYTDGKFQRNYNEAKRLGIPLGVYWFSKAISVDDAKKEADYFYENILKGRQFELPVFIDVEDLDMLSLGSKLLTDVVETWCDRLEKKGWWVGIYSTVHAFAAYLDDSRLQKYTHWVAQWASKCTYPNTDVLGLWQFGGEVNYLRIKYVAGVVCDQNYMYFDFPKFIKEKGLNGFAFPPTASPEATDRPQKEKTVSALADEVLRGLWGVGSERKDRLTKAGYDYNEVQALVDKIVASRAMDNKIKVGELVKLTPDGVIYGTDRRFADFVYKTHLYVREISGKRAVISTAAEGPVTGAVDVKHLTKFRG